MSTPRTIVSLTLLVGMTINTAFAERAPRPKEELTKSSSNIIHGVVENFYERKARKGMFEDTYIVAEIVVSKVEKGTELRVGDRVYAKFWSKSWLGPAITTPPGTYGFRPTPSRGDSSGVYLKGDRKSGFEVLHPNGFFDIKTASAKQ